MQPFKWLTDLADTARIAIDYRGYRSRAKRHWVEEAVRQHSTKPLEQEKKTRILAPMREVDREFDQPIKSLETKLPILGREIDERKCQLALVLRDFTSELESANHLLCQLRGELAECKKNLSEAFQDLKSTKDELDSWYSWAEGQWIGNGGERLPRHSFFGQDLSTRDRLKAARDRASLAVSRLKSERSRLKQRIQEIRDSIPVIRNQAETANALLRQGLDATCLRRTIYTLEAKSKAMRSEIEGLKKERETFLMLAHITFGIAALDKQIRQLNEARDARIKDFDDAEEESARKARHRSEWLARHR